MDIEKKFVHLLALATDILFFNSYLREPVGKSCEVYRRILKTNLQRNEPGPDNDDDGDVDDDNNDDGNDDDGDDGDGNGDGDDDDGVDLL